MKRIRSAALDTVIEADNVAIAVLAMMKKRTDWVGTASNLINSLSRYGSDAARRDKRWPANGRALSGRLRRALPGLRKRGLGVTWERAAGGKARLIRISANSTEENSASQPSQRHKLKDSNGSVETQNVTDAMDAVAGNVTNNDLKASENDGRDERDAKIPTQKGGGSACDHVSEGVFDFSNVPQWRQA